MLAQGAINHLRYQGLAGLFGQAVAQATIDEGHLKALDAIMGDVGHKIHIVDVKLAVGLAVGVNLTKQFDLVLVEVLANLFHRPDVAEKLGA